MADIAHVQFAGESVWVGEKYTSRDDMRNALYSRAKVSRFDNFEALPFPDRGPEHLVQMRRIDKADWYGSVCTI